MVLTDTSPQALMRANRENFASFGRAMVRVLPEARLRDEDGLLAYTCGLPSAMLNGVGCSDLDPFKAGDQIAQVLTMLRKRGNPAMWMVWSIDRPPDLAARLEAAGLKPFSESPCMGMALSDLPAREPLPTGLEIRQVRSAREMEAFLTVMAEVFQLDAASKEGFRLVLWPDATNPEATNRHYLGLWEGQPVATASAIYAAGVVGLYSISTRVGYRGRGIGHALTLAPLYDAQQGGYHAATLQSSTLGKSVYERLGFVTHGSRRPFFLSP